MLLRLGAAGAFGLGVLDSSFLFMPLGNDLLVTALTLRNKQWMMLYVLAAAAGSALGVLLVDLVARRGGEKGLKKMLSQRRFDYLKNKMSKRASIPLALACLAPPPFPFTPVIITASAFHYPRGRLLAIVFAARVLRFSIVASLARVFGSQILRLAKTDAFIGVMVGIIVISVIGSVFSVGRWIKQSRNRAATAAAEA
jgi:membrane protein YqaA with SNARE-associated domain